MLGVDGAYAHVDRARAPGAGGEVDIGEGRVEVGQEPPAQLGCLAGTRDDLNDGACERGCPGAGIGKLRLGGGDVGQAGDAGPVCLRK